VRDFPVSGPSYSTLHCCSPGHNADYSGPAKPAVVDDDDDAGDDVLCEPVKQIQLRHCPAVLSISIVDRTLQPLPGCLDVQQDTSSKTADMTGGHHAVICTEDQLKVQQTLYLTISSPRLHLTCL